MTASNDSGTSRDSASAHGRKTKWNQVAQRHYEYDQAHGLTTEVVYAIADAKGVSPRDIRSPPLYDIVDIPAIEDAFFTPSVGTRPRHGSGTIEFEYTEYLVTIGSDGWIRIFETVGKSDSGPY